MAAAGGRWAAAISTVPVFPLLIARVIIHKTSHFNRVIQFWLLTSMYIYSIRRRHLLALLMLFWKHFIHTPRPFNLPRIVCNTFPQNHNQRAYPKTSNPISEATKRRLSVPSEYCKHQCQNWRILLKARILLGGRWLVTTASLSTWYSLLRDETQKCQKRAHSNHNFSGLQFLS